MKRYPSLVKRNQRIMLDGWFEVRGLRFEVVALAWERKQVVHSHPYSTPTIND
jgi:hypothetical protein